MYYAVYHRIADATITRISTTTPGNTLIYTIFQNVNHSYNSGIEMVFSQELARWYSFNFNVDAYQNRIDAFTVQNTYPVPHIFSVDKQEIISGNIKFNNSLKLHKDFDAQVTAVYLAPDIISQGKISERFSLDFGFKKKIQKGMGELFLNATDILNTMNIRKQIKGNDFNYLSVDYYETQVVRIGYMRKF